MKSKTKIRLKEIVIFILGVVFALCMNALADACITTVDSSNVTYDDTDVETALNDLYAVNTGTAGASQVLAGYTFSNDSDIGVSGTMATLTSSNFSGTHSSTTAGAASNYTVKSTSAGYVANNTTVNTLAAATSPIIATTSASGTQTINIKPGYYNKIRVNQNNAYNKGKSDGGASWVQVWSGSTTGNISVSLSAYKYVVIQTNGGSWLILQVGGSAGYIGHIGTSPDGMWGTWGGTRGYQATTSGINGTTDLYGATENKGRSWISITKVWGIKNLN